MEILKRKKSLKLLTLDTLLRRLTEYDMGDHSYYKDMYSTQKKGYDGEVSVDQIWKEMNIPSPYYLYHGYETINDVGN